MPETKCLFCSLQCPAAVEKSGMGSFEPSFPLVSGEAKPLCGRGSLTSELLSHPRRLTQARLLENGALRFVSGSFALSALALLLQKEASGAKTAFILDGNIHSETLRLGVAFAKGVLPGSRVSVFLPPPDEQALMGLEASDAPIASWEELPRKELIISIGDPFSTHPVAARKVLSTIRSDRTKRLVAVGPSRSRTSRHAHSFIEVRPGSMGVFLAACAGALPARPPELEAALSRFDLPRHIERARIDIGQVRELMAMAASTTTIFLFQVSMGREDDFRLPAALLGLLVRALKASIIPLLSYGGSVAAYEVSRLPGVTLVPEAMTKALEGLDALVLAGLDIASFFPDDFFEQVLKSVKNVIYVSPFAPSREVRHKPRLIFPGAFWFESEGTVLDQRGQSAMLSRLASPPSGAWTLKEFFEGLARELGRERLLEEALEELPLKASAPPSLQEMLQPPEIPTAGEGKLLLFSTSSPYHFADGSVTKNCEWPNLMEPEPLIHVSREDSSKLHLEPGLKVLVKSKYGSLETPLVIDPEISQGSASVSEHFAEARQLFGWKPASASFIRSGPVEVEVSPVAS